MLDIEIILNYCFDDGASKIAVVVVFSKKIEYCREKLWNEGSIYYVREALDVNRIIANVNNFTTITTHTSNNYCSKK